MKREDLVALIGSAAAERGYAFHTGEEHAVNGAVRVYPAAWLVPPVVREHTGRREGETTWRLTVHLMTLPEGGAELETQWRELERDALGMVERIASRDTVCAVSNVRCTPARQSLTVHGEISVALVCDITMWYYL